MIGCGFNLSYALESFDCKDLTWKRVNPFSFLREFDEWFEWEVERTEKQIKAKLAESVC